MTGMRVREPNASAFERRPSRKAGRNASGVSSTSAQAVPKEQSYAAFLEGLQAAVRADDRRAAIALIAFPLRVNSAGRTKIYRDAASVERDFDSIFTRQVRRAILKQSAGDLFVRDLGVMIGDGEVWFDQTCPNAGCSPAGPVRILAVNP